MAPPSTLFTLRKSKIRARDFPQGRMGWACFLSKRGLRTTRYKHVQVEKKQASVAFLETLQNSQLTAFVDGESSSKIYFRTTALKIGTRKIKIEIETAG